MEVIEELRTRSLDVIFAEPVGSCTDISATVFGPLREEFDYYRVAPFTVLADPARSAALLSEDADSDMAFLFQKQLQEADLVCMSKADLYPDAAGLSGIEARWLSAKTGEGVQEWLDEILFGSTRSGEDDTGDRLRTVRARGSRLGVAQFELRAYAVVARLSVAGGWSVS
jgi:G3E family GTPase